MKLWVYINAWSYNPMTTTLRAAGFIATIGVNTHIPYTDGLYADLADVESDIAYLGVDYVRDGITNGADGSAPFSSYLALAEEGIKFTFCIASGGAITTASMNATLALIVELNTDVPGSVEAVEGVNEINNSGATFNGVGGLTGAVNLQKALYKAVTTNPALTGVAVDYFTGYNAGSIGVGPDPATTAGLANFDTQHPYPSVGEAPEAFVAPSAALGNEKAPYGPAVYTETGYSTYYVSQDVQAKYTLDLLMDDAANGITQTDLYDLLDAYAPNSPQGDDGYGLFDYTNTPKEAATAIHNLTTILGDTGSNATTFTTTAFNYSLTGLPAAGNSLLIEKSNGASDIVVWAEPQIWNANTNTEITVPATIVTVNLGATYGTVEVFDPLTSSSPIQTLSNVSSVPLSVTDHPLIVEVEPGGSIGPAPPPPTPDTLVLNVGEGSGRTNAQFTVSVDGTQVGGTYTVTASEAAGGGQNITLTDPFGAAGAHDITVSYINASGDGGRMLFVNAISVDGLASFTDPTQVSSGTNFYTVQKPDVPLTSNAGSTDTLVLNLSETAAAGKIALFMVSVDGQIISGIETVTASHAKGKSQNITLTGNFGSGSHTVAVDLLNGGNGGTLYVNSITLDGSTTTENASQTLVGPASYTV
jgi:hypothetical protein